jgi:hypothetical protein
MIHIILLGQPYLRSPLQGDVKNNHTKIAAVRS